MDILFILGIIAIIIIFSGLKIVPQQEAWLIQKLGKYDRVLEPGLNIIIPFIQKVAYKHTLKEQAINIGAQTAISNDNVTLVIDGILYVKIIDPVAASYGVYDPYFAISQLAQTTMRSEIGKLPLDKTFEERENLNSAIVATINEAATHWGIQCMRYEIKDIEPPESVLKAMELQVAAERQKRAKILESEGHRQSIINHAEGDKADVVLNSEAAYTDQVNRARGEAEAIEMVAKATATSINEIARAVTQQGGSDAVSLRVAEQYIEAFGKLASKNNSIIVPSNLSDPSALVAQVMGVFSTIKKGQTNSDQNNIEEVKN